MWNKTDSGVFQIVCHRFRHRYVPVQRSQDCLSISEAPAAERGVFLSCTRYRNMHISWTLHGRWATLARPVVCIVERGGGRRHVVVRHWDDDSRRADPKPNCRARERPASGGGPRHVAVRCHSPACGVPTPPLASRAPSRSVMALPWYGYGRMAPRMVTPHVRRIAVSHCPHGWRQQHWWEVSDYDAEPTTQIPCSMHTTWGHIFF